MTSGEERSNLRLVREVEKRPLLYNYKLQDHSKRDLVEDAWSEIGEVMNDDAINCREKWRNLRTVFVRKLKPPAEGIVRRKSYYLGDAMAFLIPFIKLQRSENEISPEQSESENVKDPDAPEYVEQEADNAMQTVNVNMVTCDEVQCMMSKLHPELTEHVSECCIEPKRAQLVIQPDESRKYFLLSLLPDVQRLTNNQMKVFRRKMLDALEEAEACPAYEVTENEEGARSGSCFHNFIPKREC